MAARAHVARDYSFGDVPRRDVYFRREDPVVLPRSREFSIDFRLIGAALLLASILLAAGVGRRSFHGAFPLLLFAVILVCASAFAFFTWIPLWFMIGYLTIRTNFKGER